MIRMDTGDRKVECRIVVDVAEDVGQGKVRPGRGHNRRRRRCECGRIPNNDHGGIHGKNEAIRNKREHTPRTRRGVHGRVWLYYGGNLVCDAFSELQEGGFDFGRYNEHTFSLGERHGCKFGTRAG